MSQNFKQVTEDGDLSLRQADLLKSEPVKGRQGIPLQVQTRSKNSSSSLQ